MSVKVSSLLWGEECGKTVSTKRPALVQVIYLHFLWLLECGNSVAPVSPDLQGHLYRLILWVFEKLELLTVLLPLQGSEQWPLVFCTSSSLLSLRTSHLLTFTVKSWEILVSCIKSAYRCIPFTKIPLVYPVLSFLCICCLFFFPSSCVTGGIS